MSPDQISHAAAQEALQSLGALHDSPTTTLVLLGPLNPGFWPHFQSSPEAQDGQRDPLDRWSHRVLSNLAQALSAEPVFPFGGPPYAPFLSWALDSGQAWTSPLGMLVHATEGLMVSYRGALRFDGLLPLPETGQNPCPPCAKPCTTACPVDALGPDGYDVAACHAHLDSPSGGPCLSGGCLARRACPISEASRRAPAQSAFHMQAFRDAR